MSDEGGGEKVPLWIISFADMITLLLAFFVMLQTLACDQNATLEGREASESFRRAIQGLGIPDLLWGKQQGADFGKLRQRNFVEPDPTPDTTDTRRLLGDEEARSAFAEMEKAMATKSTPLSEVTISKRIIPLAFEPGTAKLTPEGTAALLEYVRAVRDTRSGEPTRVYVIGLAGENLSPAKGWALSAERAAAAQRVLEPLAGDLLQQGLWQICSQGSFDLTHWRQVYGTGVEKAHVLLAVTEVRTDGE